MGQYDIPLKSAIKTFYFTEGHPTGRGYGRGHAIGIILSLPTTVHAAPCS